MPLKQYSGTRDIIPDLHPVHTVCHQRVSSLTTRHCKVCGCDVDDDEIYRGFLVGGRYKVIDPPSRDQTISGIAFEQFANPHDFDSAWIDEQRWLGPPDERPDDFNEFRTALAESGAVVVCRVRTTGVRARLAVLEPRGHLLAMLLLHYSAELVRPKDIPEPAAAPVNRERVARLAAIMGNNVRAFDHAAYSDEYRNALYDAIQRGVDRASGIVPAPPALILPFRAGQK